MLKISYYKGLTPEELAADPAFREWCLGKNDQVSFWELFLEKHPERTTVVEQAHRLVIGVADHFANQEVSQKTMQKRYRKTLSMARQEADRTRPRRLKHLISIAATIALLLALAAVGYHNFIERGASVPLVYKTDFGEQRSVRLPDGSTVRLNADSRLTLGEDWAINKDRDVWLEGEAYFSVENKATSGAKFTVHVREVSVEVLGTRFNVNARAEATEVALDEGKIRLYSSTDSTEVTMAPGEVVSVRKEVAEFTRIENADAQIYSSWKEGYLIYKDASLATVLEDVRHTFGFTIVVTDSLALNESITGALSVSDPDELLLILRDIMPRVSFSREGKKLTVDMK